MATDPSIAQRSLTKRALLAIRELQRRLETEGSNKDPIAVIGLACRFPGGADTPSKFWQVLVEGVDTVTEVPADRWDASAYYDPDPSAPAKISTRFGAFLDHVGAFDAAFFGVSAREAAAMDPQQRILVETSYEALERAGLPVDRLAGSDTGVFVGIGTHDYESLLMHPPLGHLGRSDPYTATGNVASVAVGRVSYLLGLEGPNVALDTACSSSLVAVHLACQSLRQRECALALAGGVNLILSPVNSVNLTKLQALAPDGRCKAFDAGGNGFGRGEGCGVVVLKRLSDAVADRDSILAIVRGSAINQDGRSAGLTVPSVRAQERVIRTALANGGVDPGDVGYVETHGTGTVLGDPIEVRALTEALCRERPADAPLIIGSVKTNIGHLESCAGIAGFIKLVLCLQHGQIPQSLHFHSPNPHIPWASIPLKVSGHLVPWTSAGRRVGGVSSFAFSGTNAHVVVEQAPVAAPTLGTREPTTSPVLPGDLRQDP